MRAAAARVFTTSMVCGMASAGDEQSSARFVPLERVHHVHRFGRGGGLIEQGRVGDRQGREVAHHRLEIEESFEPALGHLGLVRRVGGVPARILDDVPLDHRRRDAVGVSESQIRFENLVVAGRLAQLAQVVKFADGFRQIERLLEPDSFRNRFLNQRIKRARPGLLEHRIAFCKVGTNMAGLEGLRSKSIEVCALILAGPSNPRLRACLSFTARPSTFGYCEK